MKTQKEDRRSRKTKALIQQTLIEQLSTRELKDISVSEIANRADINRGTFYLHYHDVYDVLEQLEQRLFEEFTTFIEKYKEYPAGSRISVLLDLFQYIEANAAIFATILRTKEATILTRIIEGSRPQTAEEWQMIYVGAMGEEYGGLGDVDFNYCYEFIAYGCVAMLRRWFDNGMKEPAEHMAKLAEKLMTSSITAL